MDFLPHLLECLYTLSHTHLDLRDHWPKYSKIHSWVQPDLQRAVYTQFTAFHWVMLLFSYVFIWCHQLKWRNLWETASHSEKTRELSWNEFKELLPISSFTESGWKARPNNHLPRSPNTKIPKNKEIHSVIHKEKKIPSTWYRNQSINAPKFNFERSRTWALYYCQCKCLMYKMNSFSIYILFSYVTFFWSYLSKCNFISVEYNNKNWVCKKFFHYVMMAHKGLTVNRVYIFVVKTIKQLEKRGTKGTSSHGLLTSWLCTCEWTLTFMQAFHYFDNSIGRYL